MYARQNLFSRNADPVERLDACRGGSLNENASHVRRAGNAPALL